MKILSPKNDLVFKALFGDEKNKDLTIALINDLLERDDILDITFLDPNTKIISPEDKYAILDVKALTNKDEIIDIEIQVNDTPAFAERILYYASRLITEQLEKGARYQTLKNVIVIVITGYYLFPQTKEYQNSFEMKSQHDITLTDVLKIHTFELPKIPFSNKKKKFAWLNFLRTENEDELETLQETFHDEKVDKAVDKLKNISLNDEMRAEYNYRLKADLDYNSKMYDAKMKGWEQGIEQGIEQERKTIALNLLKNNIDIELIKQATGLREKEILNLTNS